MISYASPLWNNVKDKLRHHRQSFETEKHSIVPYLFKASSLAERRSSGSGDVLHGVLKIIPTLGTSEYLDQPGCLANLLEPFEQI